MKLTPSSLASALALAPLAFLGLSSAASAQKLPAEMVQMIRCPDEGVQPRIVLDGAGVLHLVYFKGLLAAGDLYYVRSFDHAQSFTDPIRVNRRVGNVDASDGIRGARIAFGPSGRVHVAWVGATEEGAEDDRRALYYTRSTPERDGFELERRLGGATHRIDAAPNVVDGHNGVHVFWHEPEYQVEIGAAPPGPASDASKRAPGTAAADDRIAPRMIYMVHSTDGGETFSSPQPIEMDGHQVMARCALGAGVQEDGTVYLLFQGKKDGKRDWRLLTSRDGSAFRCRFVDNWDIPRKVSTSATIVPGDKMLLAAYESYGRVWFTRIDAEKRRTLLPYKARDTADWRGRPSVTDNTNKIALLSWVEGERPGEPERVVWQAFYLPERRNIGMGRVHDVSEGTVPAAFTRPDQSFCVLY